MKSSDFRLSVNVATPVPGRSRRPLKLLLADNPPAHCGASGGRDRWSAPLQTPPTDGNAALWTALDEVLDPELPVSLVELGLIYRVEFEEGVARISLTFTAAACPCMEFIREDVKDRLTMEPWVNNVEITEVWDPPWTTSRISPAGREKLKNFGVGAA